MTYYGLDHLDHQIAQWVDRPDGFFVELGAFDGLTQSNSLHFEQRGWRGLLIEPEPEAYRRCCKNRPHCDVVQCACVAEDYSAPTIAMQAAGLMSIVEGARGSASADSEWLARAERAQSLRRRALEVPARTLSAVLDARAAPPVDLLLLDVEGYELNVLRGIDFSRHRPEYIVCESSGDEAVLVAFLESKDYTLCKTLAQREHCSDLLFHVNRPLSLSVYITSYNQRDFLRAAIDSVLAQTLLPDEILIVDDASSDGSQELIAHYAARHPDRIRAIVHETNRGIAATRTHALSHVRGDLVSYLDGDDLFSPRKLEREVRAWRQALRPNAVVFSNYAYLNAQAQEIGAWNGTRAPLPEGDVLAATLMRNFPDGRLFRYELIPTALLEQTGLYDSALEVYEDWDFKVRLAGAASFVYLDESLSGYRLHGANISATRRRAVFEHYFDVLYKHRDRLRAIPELQRRELLDRLARHSSRHLATFLKWLTDLPAAPLGEAEQRTALDDRLAAVWSSMARCGATRIAVYGAGRHTRKLGAELAAAPVQIQMVLDDNPAGPATLWGWPVRPPAPLEQLGIDAILISSDAFEEELYSNLMALGLPAERCFRLYGGSGEASG